MSNTLYQPNFTNKQTVASRERALALAYLLKLELENELNLWLPETLVLRREEISLCRPCNMARC